MRILSSLAVAAGVFIAAPASAQVFTDDFNSEPVGAPSSLSNFAITGTIDVVAPANPYGITVSGPASGNVVDIDGTPGPGSILSLSSFAFNAGDLINLSFVLGGSQRGGGGDSFTTSFVFGGLTNFSGISGTGLFAAASGAGAGSSLTRTIFVPGATPFTSSSLSFIAGNAGTLQFGFGTTSADNVGPLIDNVALDITAVPEPATWAMLLIGFGAIGGAMRRGRSSVRAKLAYC